MTRYWVITGALFVATLGLPPVSVSASTITLDATTRGVYDQTGATNGAFADGPYAAGDYCTLLCIGPSVEYRNWFEFNLSGASGTVTSAVLLLDNPACSAQNTECGYLSTSSPSETYSLFDVEAGNVGSLGSTTSLAIFTDLGGGTSFGSHVGTSADNGTTVAIPLDAAALTAIQAALGSNFALGGAVTTLNGVSDNEYIFGFSYFSADHARLQLTTSTSAVPEPTSMLLLGTGIVGIGARRWRNRRQRG